MYLFIEYWLTVNGIPYNSIIHVHLTFFFDVVAPSKFVHCIFIKKIIVGPYKHSEKQQHIHISFKWLKYMWRT